MSQQWKFVADFLGNASRNLVAGRLLEESTASIQSEDGGVVFVRSAGALRPDSWHRNPEIRNINL